MGGGRALSEERKGIFAGLPAQKHFSLVGAESATLEKNYFLLALCKCTKLHECGAPWNFLQEDKLAGAKVSFLGH